MIKIQALEWLQRRIQGLVLNKVTKDWPVYTNRQHYGIYMDRPKIDLSLYLLSYDSIFL